MSAGSPKGFADLDDLEAQKYAIGMVECLGDIVDVLTPFNWEGKLGLCFTSNGVDLNASNGGAGGTARNKRGPEGPDCFGVEAFV